MFYVNQSASYICSKRSAGGRCWIDVIDPGAAIIQKEIAAVIGCRIITDGAVEEGATVDGATLSVWWRVVAVGSIRIYRVGVTCTVTRTHALGIGPAEITACYRSVVDLFPGIVTYVVYKYAVVHQVG